MNTPSMRYIPNAGEDVREMLETIGVDRIDALFASIPAEVKLDRDLQIPGPWSEIEVRRAFGALAAKNVAIDATPSFLGAGVYYHYQPACIDQLLLRGEFLTAYTPYQPEVSQGTLQAIFEYQTHQCLLTELDVANASLYDGSTAFVEGVLLCERATNKRTKVVIAKSIHPEYRQTLTTYIQNLGIEVVEVGWGTDGRVDLDAMRAAVDDNTFAVAVQSPNFFGVLEDYAAVRDIADAKSAQKIAVIAEATSLGVVNPPGRFGFDVAVGEAQAWGIAPSFGGPFVGFMVVRDALKRHMPGRLVGETIDVDGKRAYVLTLATREQHIRRAKATSNICTNQALFALAANMYLSLMGKRGLREVAMQCIQKSEYLKKQLDATGVVSFPFSGPTYNEFTVRLKKPAGDVLAAVEKDGFIGGLELARFFPETPNDLLIAVTEMHTKEHLDGFAASLARASKETK